MRARRIGVIGFVIAAVVAAGCKDKQRQPTSSGSGSAVEIKVDWQKCDGALANAAASPLAARPAVIIDGCRVCGGDWTPLLRWNIDPATGGPKREQIEQLMTACNAFCTGTAKLEFMAGVDKARGQDVNSPWRKLENTCKDKVNGAADDRFMSAAFFALDRIARAAAARGGATAEKLAVLDLPLPAVTISGSGVVLPDSDAVTPKVGELQVTVLGDAVYIGRMPRAKLTANGVTAQLGSAGYPGDAVKLDQLGAKLGELVGGDNTQTITILAPHAMPAINLVPIIAAASASAPVYLGANAYDSPEGWQLAGAIPIALDSSDGIAVSDEMTVQNLASELATRVARKQNRVGVTKH